MPLKIEYTSDGIPYYIDVPEGNRLYNPIPSQQDINQYIAPQIKLPVDDAFERAALRSRMAVKGRDQSGEDFRIINDIRPIDDSKPQPLFQPLLPVETPPSNRHWDLSRMANVFPPAIDPLAEKQIEGERYQLWPEKMLRSGLSLGSDVIEGKVKLPSRDFDPKYEPEAESALGRIQDMSGLAGSGAFGAVAIRGAEKNALGVVPVAAAKTLKVTPATEASNILKQAIENTPGASLSPEGHLIVNVSRKQHPDQDMAESVRGGVFYLPTGDRNLRHYGTSTNNYGGSQKIQGKTAYINPLVVKGATGGRAPEQAYNTIKNDKKAYEQLNREVMEVVNASVFNRKEPWLQIELAQRFLEKHSPELINHAEYILANSKQGNQLRYALQEAAIASAARQAGYDGIIGYSHRRSGPGMGKPFISEIFDVRENRYPSPSGDYSVHPSLLSDTSKPGAAISALGNTKPQFYSAVEKAIEAIPQTKMSGDQWLGTLQNKPGVKPEEIEWLGLGGLKGKGEVSKAELMDIVGKGKVELKETNLGNSEYWQLFYKDTLPRQLEVFGPVLNEIKTLSDVALAKKHNISFRETVKGKGDIEIFKAVEEAKKLPQYDDKFFQKYDTEAEALKAIEDAKAEAHIDKIKKSTNIETKYHSYQLPGADNYREVLLGLPGKNKLKWEELSVKKQNEIKQLHDDMKMDMGDEFGWNSPKHLYEELILKTPELYGSSKIQPDIYQSSHWDEPNVLAHLRMNDRSIDNKRSLHLEEIQSDWHQAGRDKGYKGLLTPELKSQGEALFSKIENHPDKKIVEQIITNPDEKAAIQLAVEKGILSKAEGDLYKRYSQAEQGEQFGVPNAPFKKTWHELALKRALMEAVEKGYDRLSWTPGEAQAARYDLSKHVDKLSYNGNRLWAWDKNGKQVINKEVSKDKLADHIGKQAAEKLLNQPRQVSKGAPGPDYQTLEGADLKIGGEGMRGFYDQIIPKALEKISGEKVKSGNLPVNERDLITKKQNLRDLGNVKPDEIAQEKYIKHWDSLVANNKNIHYLLGTFDSSKGVNHDIHQISRKLNIETDPKKIKYLEEQRRLLHGTKKRLEDEMRVIEHGMDKIHKLMVDETIDRIIKAEKGQPIHYIDITPSLKQKVMQGFPLFTGPNLVPVLGDPFSSKKYKLVPVQGNPFK